MTARRSAFRSMALLAALSLSSPPASAEAELVAGTGLDAKLESLVTGDQLVIEGQDRTIAFAGRSVVLKDAAAVLGYASEVAYLAVIEGEASLGELTAGRGEMLLVPPFGGEAVVERFDARRLAEALAEEGPVQGSAALASLERLAHGQDRGVFLGRLARTDFNVATLGSAEAEIDRRSRVGGAAIREVRFAAVEPGADVEQAIVERFLEALAAGNVATVAQMLDPLPYGYGTLANGGGEARRLMAEALIAERDWSAFAAGPPAKAGETRWVASGGGRQATIDLRRTTDFAFVQSIQVGG